MKKDAVIIAAVLENASPYDLSLDDEPLVANVSNNPAKKLIFKANDNQGEEAEERIGTDQNYYFASQETFDDASDTDDEKEEGPEGKENDEEEKEIEEKEKEGDNEKEKPKKKDPPPPTLAAAQKITTGNNNTIHFNKGIP